MFEQSFLNDYGFNDPLTRIHELRSQQLNQKEFVRRIKNMAKRKIKSIVPTMKINTTQENDVEFQAVKAVIEQINDVTTTFGQKTVAVLNAGDANFCVFVNSISMNNLIKAYGDDDDAWIGKTVKTKKEKDTKFKKDMIVLVPVSD